MSANRAGFDSFRRTSAEDFASFANSRACLASSAFLSGFADTAVFFLTSYIAIRSHRTAAEGESRTRPPGPPPQGSARRVQRVPFFVTLTVTLPGFWGPHLTG